MKPTPRPPIPVPPPCGPAPKRVTDLLLVLATLVGVIAFVAVPVALHDHFEPCDEYVWVKRSMVATDGTPVEVDRSVCLAWKPGRAPDGGVP